MFPFKPRKTRWEIARDTVLDAAHDAAGIASHAATAAAVKAGTAATSATIASKHILENVEDKLQHSLHNSGETAQHLKENLSDSLSRSAQVADQRAHQALERAQETAQSARETAASKAAAQRKVFAHKKDDLAHTLHDKSEHAREVAAQTAARLSRKRDEVAENAAQVAENAQDAKRFWLQRGSEVLDGTTEKAHELATQKSDELDKVTKKSRKEISRRAKDAKEDAARLVKANEPSEDARVEIEEGSSNAMWIAIGLAVGAVVALLLWPKVGRRNRAALQDKFAEVKDSATETVHNVAEKAADKAEDLSRRAGGLAHEVHVAATSPVGTDNPIPETTADDITIADRVRSELGRTALGEEIFLNIDSVEGNVSVRGALPDMTTQIELEAIIRAIPGVRDVIFDTPAPDAPPLEDSLNHQTEIAERVTESHLADAVEKPAEQPKNESPADQPFVG